MSEPLLKLSPDLMLTLQLSSTSVALAQANHDKLLLRIERDHGIRFEYVNLLSDGTVEPKK